MTTHEAKPAALVLDPILMDMALGIARSYLRRLPANVQREDIEQAALIGLMKALRKDPDGEGDGWLGYLRLRIRGAIIDELRAQDWATRRQRRGSHKDRSPIVRLEDMDPEWEDLLPGVSDNPELLAIERLDAAKAWRAPINAGDLRILRAHFEGGMLQRDVAVAEGLSEPRISQRNLRGIMGMRAHMVEPTPLALWRLR